MNKKLNICLVAPLPPPKGGISHWTEMVSDYSKATNIEILNLDTAVRWRDVDDLAVLKRSIGGAIQLIKIISKFFLILIKKKPDLIHITTSGGLGVIRDLFLLIFSKMFRTPVVYHIRFGRIPEIKLIQTIEWKLLRIALRLTTKVIAIDTQTEMALKGSVENLKLINVPNCFNGNKFPKINKANDNLKVCFLGWVIKSKGIEELLTAWKLINKTHQEVELSIVGPFDEDYRKYLVNNFNVNNVTFFGALTHQDAMHELSQCGIFILPSHTEGFPNSVLEAMVLGRAIISTNVGAVPEMLSHNCGVIIEPFSSEQVEFEILRLIENESFRKEIGDNAKLRAYANYSIESVFNKYISIWEDCLD